MKPQTTLVGPEGRVELNPVPAVDLHITIVVFPCDAELNHTFRDGNDRQSSLELGGDFKKLGIRESGDKLWIRGIRRQQIVLLPRRKALTIVSLLELGLRRKVAHGAGLMVGGLIESRGVVSVRKVKGRTKPNYSGQARGKLWGKDDKSRRRCDRL